MSDNEQESDYTSSSDVSDLEYEFDDGGITPFLFEPSYTEEEIEERLRRHESGELSISNVQTIQRPCSCDACVDMKIEGETLCCNEALSTRLDDFNGKKCVTDTRPF